MTDVAAFLTIDSSDTTRRDRFKLQVILNHEAEVTERVFRKLINNLPVELGNPTQFWSRARLVKGFDLIAGAVGDFGLFALDQAEQLPTVSDRYDLVESAIEDLWTLLCEWVPIITWPPYGKPIAGYAEVEAEEQLCLARARRRIDGLTHFCESGRQIDRRKLCPASDPAAPPASETYPKKPLGLIPQWLNLYQAAAWVCFRTQRAMVTLDRASLLHAEIRYSGVAEVETLDDFEAALRSGRPVATGRLAEAGSYEEIPAETWSSFPAAALYPDDAAPYRDIRMRRDVLFAVFPTLETLAKQSKRPVTTASNAFAALWFEALSIEDKKLSREALYLKANDGSLDFRITDIQIRSLTPGRKPGPKSKSGNIAS